MKKFSFAWLLIVPAIVFTFNFFFVKNQDRFYMNWTDSSYAYLFNGMNLANGKMEIGHTDNPGTTVQIAAGVLIKLIHVFSGKNPDLVNDVLTDPEKYLHILSFIFIVSSCLILFYLGYVVRKWSANTWLAIFIQSGIIVSFPSLTCMADIRSEPLLIMGGFLYVAICFSFIHEKEMTQKKMFRYSIKFAAICAFLIITKMTAVPVAILPFFLLRKWKSYFLYLAALPVFTILFFFPALPKTKIFFHWVKDLFFHSGFYGQGKTSIIDFSTAGQNLIYMSYDIPFVICCSIMFAAL
ncbi:MAG TPA: hypothetical protein VFJ43_08830, partial [Bacteroidia bacterium]|nr:hypothetical protein [Bacteroidia bacterium]